MTTPYTKLNKQLARLNLEQAVLLYLSYNIPEKDIIEELDISKQRLAEIKEGILYQLKRELN